MQQRHPNVRQSHQPDELGLSPKNGRQIVHKRNPREAENHRSEDPTLRKSASSKSLTISTGSMPTDRINASNSQTCLPGGAESIDKADAISNCTNTSDVHSYDDAASIASRLSRIICEQQRKYLSQEALNASNSTSPVCKLNRWPSNNSLSSLSDNQPGSSRQSHLSGTKSSSKLAYQPTSTRESSSSSPDAASEAGSKLVLSGATHARPKEQVLPVTSSADSRECKLILAPPRTNRDRTRSFGTNAAAVALEATHMRRTDSAGHLPERGDLRSLENSHRDASLTAIQRCNRSNTLGEVDKSALLNQNGSEELMLSIRRSAWTLSEFDQTVN